MTIFANPARSRGIHAVTPTLLAAVAIALGFPASSDAQPTTGGGGSNSGEWDIGAYDSCMHHYSDPYHGSGDENYDYAAWCCYSTGGVWTSNHCQAPPGEATSSPLGPGPQQAPPRGVQAPPPPLNPTSPVNPGRIG